MAPQAGLLYVTMHPHGSLPPAQFHDWYNNEHGPLRLRLPFCTSGLRYQATDLDASGPSAEKPEWMALYDVTDVQELVKPPYTTLREPGTKTQRESDTMAQIDVGRHFYDLVKEWTSEGYRAPNLNPENSVLISVSLFLKSDTRGEVEDWYNKEHVDLLSKVPGWQRSRLFALSTTEDPSAGATQLMALHEYASSNGIGGPEMLAAVGTEWSGRVLGRGSTSPAEALTTKIVRRQYKLSYVFGPAPRDLAVLKDETALKQWAYSNGKTQTLRAEGKGSARGVVESYITARDGVEIEYRLEGNGGDESSLIVLSNSVLVKWGVWDGFVDEMLSDAEFKDWRVLRYHTRGRYKDTGKKDVTLDVLTDDVIDLLDALRVKRAAAIVGVSLGGATAMSVGLKYPNRVAAFVACDTNAKSPAGNEKAWGERIEMAEKQNTPGDQVGTELAEATVRRWFPEESYQDKEIAARIETVKSMVETNSLAGFKKAVRALFDYDIEGLMESYKGKGAFVVGEKDGKLPTGMKAMAESLGRGVDLQVIPLSGHLPMVERPAEVASFVKRILQV